MSRTYRKRQESFEKYYGEGLSFNNSVPLIETWDKKERQRQKAIYYTETNNWYSGNLPKDYRKTVNKKRRARDKQAIFDFVNRGNEDACFDPWNCKTNNTWGYW